MTSVDAVMANAGTALLGNPPTLVFTRDVCRSLIRDRIPGAFVECGVAAGSHPAVMAAVAHEAHDPRLIHLLDSFEGIPIAGPEDDCQPGMSDADAPPRTGELRTTGISAASAAQVAANLAAWGAPLGNCRFHRGWFQDVVPIAALTVGPIAFLRLDGDLYESTRVCLEHLYPLVVPGGVVVADDYALTGCRKAVDRYLESRGERPDIRPIEGGGDEAGGPVWWRR